VFYFSPGHETYPVYHDTHIQRILANAVSWAFAVSHATYVTAEALNAPTGWFEKL
jgi:trehalose utilization protein